MREVPLQRALNQARVGCLRTRHTLDPSTDLPGQWLRCQVNDSNVCRVLKFLSGWQLCRGMKMQGYLEKGVQTPMARGRST